MGNDLGTPSATPNADRTSFSLQPRGRRPHPREQVNAPDRPIARNGDPNQLEDWYFAIWSYNGFAFSNHPLKSRPRTLFAEVRRHAPASPAPSTVAQPDDSTSPSPRRLPAHANSTRRRPTPVVAVPSRRITGNPTEAQSYQMTPSGSAKFGQGDYTLPPRDLRVHAQIRRKQTASRCGRRKSSNMPDFTNPIVARAFAPQNFLTCPRRDGVRRRLSGDGFPYHDPPRRFRTAPDHAASRPHPRANPADAAALIAAPPFQVSNDPSASLVVYEDGRASSVPLLVKNVGSGVAPFRVKTTAPWLVVRHSGDSASRSLDGAWQSEQKSKLLRRKPMVRQPRLFTLGYDSSA